MILAVASDQSSLSLALKFFMLPFNVFLSVPIIITISDIGGPLYLLG